MIKEATMISNKFFLVSLAMAGCAVAAYAIGRHARQLERRQLEEGGLATWEDEGGNLPPPRAQAVLTAAPSASPRIP